MGAAFTWTGNGIGDAWDTCGNWDACSEAVPYPQNTVDDATIPTNATTWTVDLIDETIDDLTINGSVTFGDAGIDATLTVKTVTINGPAVVTLTEGVDIIAT